MPSTVEIQIVHRFRDYAPPFDVDAALKLLLRYVPGKYLAGLRHIVRQDPDVIMVGEIRDRETADIAIRAALTGHFVYSTLSSRGACVSAVFGKQRRLLGTNEFGRSPSFNPKGPSRSSISVDER